MLRLQLLLLFLLQLGAVNNLPSKALPHPKGSALVRVLTNAIKIIYKLFVINILYIICVDNYITK